MAFPLQAADISYNNRISHLEAKDVQSAIDELSGGGGVTTLQNCYDDSTIPVTINLDKGKLLLANNAGDPAQQLLQIRNHAQNLTFMEIKNTATGYFPSGGILGDAPAYSGSLNIGSGNTFTSGIGSITLGSGNVMNGNNSLAAMGGIASAVNCLSLGNLSSATNNNAIAVGTNVNANAANTSVIGHELTCDGPNSVLIGYQSDCEASYANSVVVGSNCTVSGSGSSSVSIGYNNNVSNTNAVGLGSANTISGAFAVGIGKSITCSGTNATAIGLTTEASGNDTIAIGSGARARATNDIVVGKSSDSSAGGSSSVIGVSSVNTGASALLFGNNITNNASNVCVINTLNSIPATIPSTYSLAVIKYADSDMLAYGKLPGVSVTGGNVQTVINTAAIFPNANANIIDVVVPINSAYIVEYMCSYAIDSITGIFSGFETGTIFGSYDSIAGFYRNRDVIKTNNNIPVGDITITNPAPILNEILLNVAVDPAATGPYQVHVSYNITIRTYH